MTLLIEPYGASGNVLARHDGATEAAVYTLHTVRADLATITRRGGHVTLGGNRFDESDLLEIQRVLRQIARRQAGAL